MEPTFANCPTGYLSFPYLNPIVLPNLGENDNVGIKSVTIVPYMLNGTAMPDKNLTVIVKAEDYEGNIGKCQFEIYGKFCENLVFVRTMKNFVF